MEIDNVATIVDVAQKAANTITLASNSHVMIVRDPALGLKVVDLEPLNTAPFRKKGHVKVFEAESFNKVMADNAVAGQAMVYINPDANAPAIVAVLNGHGHAGPGFGDHRVSIEFRVTPQWAKWKAIDGKMLAQSDFAEFIEDNLSDIASPSGAEMMEIVTYLQATRTVDFKSGVKLSNGTVQFTNNEDTVAQVGPGNIAVPDIFEIALSPVFGVTPFKVPARFRYKIEDRKLKLGFKLQRVEDVMATIIRDIEAEIVLPEGVGKVYGIAP